MRSPDAHEPLVAMQGGDDGDWPCQVVQLDDGLRIHSAPGSGQCPDLNREPGNLVGSSFRRLVAISLSLTHHATDARAAKVRAGDPGPCLCTVMENL